MNIIRGYTIIIVYTIPLYFIIYSKRMTVVPKKQAICGNFLTYVKNQAYVLKSVSFTIFIL